MMYRPIYNFEFPSWCNELNLLGYRFFRVTNYKDQILQLQHYGKVISEFSIEPNTGQHAITANVELPEKEQLAALEWSGTKNTALMDVLLLLSLFTCREVFAGRPTDEKDNFNEDLGVITRDPRLYPFGGSLRASIPYKAKKIDEHLSYNIGFEEELNRILILIRSEPWQKKYGRGFFLFLARQAFHYQTLETAFIQCWTIWEHLFTLHNQNWLSEQQIHNLSTFEKISFLLVEYALREEIDNASRSRIKDLAKIRNRLIHFGRFPERDNIREDAVLFILLTESILAKILGLTPSNVLNTAERLEAYLRVGN